MSELNHHDAADSGQRFEIQTRNLFDKLGHPVLKYLSEFKNYGVDYYKYFAIKEHPLKQYGYQRGFETDGFVPSLNAMLEIKATKQELGTAQEKVFQDLLKIEYGVYNVENGVKLLYILAGCMEYHECSILFINLVNKFKSEGHPNFQNVHVLKLSEITQEVLDQFSVPIQQTILETL